MAMGRGGRKLEHAIPLIDVTVMFLLNEALLDHLGIYKSLKNLSSKRTSFMENISNPPVSPSSPRILDDRHPGVSGTLPSPDLGPEHMKPRRFFSLRRNRRTSSTATQPAEKTVESTNPERPPNKKESSFTTIFLRRPSLRNRKSDRGLVRSSETSPESPRLSSTTTTPTTHRITRKPGLLDLHEFHKSCGRVSEKGCQPQSQALRGRQSDGQASTSDGSRGSSWSIVPIPPIIVSAPTPPDAFGSPDAIERRAANAQQSGMPSAVQLGDRKDAPKSSQVPKAIRMLQTAARQLENDPTFTQSNILQFLIPISFVLYALLILKEILFLRDPSVSQVICINVFLPLGALLVLVLVKCVIRIMSRLGHSFCELDLDEVFTRGIVDSNGEGLIESDFWVGYLIAT